MLFRNPFHRLQPMKRPGGDDSDTISRVEDLITSAFDVFAADLERFLVLAGVAKPGVPPNPSTVNRLTGPAVALTDAAGILRVDPAHFFYLPGTPDAGKGNLTLLGDLLINDPLAPVPFGSELFLMHVAGGAANAILGVNASVVLGAGTGVSPLLARVAICDFTSDATGSGSNNRPLAVRGTNGTLVVAMPTSGEVNLTSGHGAKLSFGVNTASATPTSVQPVDDMFIDASHDVTVNNLAGTGTVPVNCDPTGKLVRGSAAPAAAQYQSFQWSGLITDPSWQAISGDVRAVWCPSDAGRCAAVPVIANGRTGDTTVPAYLTDTLGSVIGYQVTPMHVTSGIRTLVEVAVCVQSLVPTFVAPADAIGFQFTIWKVTGGFPQSNPANYTAMATQGFSFSGAGFQQGAASMTISVSAIADLDFLFCEVHRTDTSGLNVLSSMTFTVNARFSA